MSFSNILLVVIIAFAAVALLVFLISRNRKDKKEFEQTGIEDTVEETKADQQRDSESL